MGAAKKASKQSEKGSGKLIRCVGKLDGVTLGVAYATYLAIGLGGLGVILSLVGLLWWDPALYAGAALSLLAVILAVIGLRAPRNPKRLVRRLVASGAEYAVLEVPGARDAVVVVGPALVVGSIRGEATRLRIQGESLWVDGRTAGPVASTRAARLSESLSSLASKVVGRRVHAVGAELYWGVETEPTLVQVRNGVVAVANAEHLADVAAGVDPVLTEGEASQIVDVLLSEGLRSLERGGGGRKKSKKARKK